MEYIEFIRVEVEAGDLIGTLALAVFQRIRVRVESRAGPFQYLFSRELWNLELDFRGELATFPHI